MPDPFPEVGSDALLDEQARAVIAADIPPEEIPMNAVSLMPIRKIMATAVAAGLTYLALQVGLDLGPEEVNEAAAAVVGIAVGYLVPDPAVKAG